MEVRRQEDTGGVADGVEMHHLTAKWGVHYQYDPISDATYKMEHNGKDWEIVDATPGHKFKVVMMTEGMVT